MHMGERVANSAANAKRHLACLFSRYHIDACLDLAERALPERVAQQVAPCAAALSRASAKRKGDGAAYRLARSWRAQAARLGVRCSSDAHGRHEQNRHSWMRLILTPKNQIHKEAQDFSCCAAPALRGCYR
jgi:hypothetical protein